MSWVELFSLQENIVSPCGDAAKSTFDSSGKQAGFLYKCISQPVIKAGKIIISARKRIVMLLLFLLFRLAGVCALRVLFWYKNNIPYLLTSETRAENGFSHAYILMILIPETTSFMMRILLSARTAVLLLKKQNGSKQVLYLLI